MESWREHMRHSMSRHSSGRKKGRSLRSRRTSCKCWCPEGEKNRAIPDPAARYRYVAHHPRSLPPFVWSAFRDRKIASEYELLELRRSGGRASKLTQDWRVFALVAKRQSGLSALQLFSAILPRIAEACSAGLGELES